MTGWLLARLLRNERRRSAALRAEVRALRGEVVDLELDVAIQTARTKQARDQRDRARDLACAVMGASEWTEGDRAWMGEHGMVD